VISLDRIVGVLLDVGPRGRDHLVEHGGVDRSGVGDHLRGRHRPRSCQRSTQRSPLTRSRCDQRTRDYLDRRTAQGLTRPEAIRCVKGYVAREIYNLVRQLDPTTEFPRTA
jgi:hypothetical protein